MWTHLPSVLCLSGIIRLSEGFHDRYPVEDYLDLFDQAAYQIQGNLTANVSGSPNHPNIIIGKWHKQLQSRKILYIMFKCKYEFV